MSRIRACSACGAASSRSRSNSAVVVQELTHFHKRRLLEDTAGETAWAIDQGVAFKVGTLTLQNRRSPWERGRGEGVVDSSR